MQCFQPLCCGTPVYHKRCVVKKYYISLYWSQKLGHSIFKEYETIYLHQVLLESALCAFLQVQVSNGLKMHEKHNIN